MIGVFIDDHRPMAGYPLAQLHWFLILHLNQIALQVRLLHLARKLILPRAVVQLLPI